MALPTIPPAPTIPPPKPPSNQLGAHMALPTIPPAPTIPPPKPPSNQLGAHMALPTIPPAPTIPPPKPPSNQLGAHMALPTIPPAPTIPPPKPPSNQSSSLYTCIVPKNMARLATEMLQIEGKRSFQEKFIQAMCVWYAGETDFPLTTLGSPGTDEIVWAGSRGVACQTVYAPCVEQCGYTPSLKLMDTHSGGSSMIVLIPQSKSNSGVFFGKRSNHPWCIFLLLTNNATRREALEFNEESCAQIRLERVARVEFEVQSSSLIA
ncbi:hypothetical protein B0H10DRAFT_1944962 [Mycena sp. CBHHK59/15]|nr:hypothetical protein B0H10DRAFT_1944962 [Mycena sp. CBHHK59/15]